MCLSSGFPRDLLALGGETHLASTMCVAEDDERDRSLTKPLASFPHVAPSSLDQKTVRRCYKQVPPSTSKFVDLIERPCVGLARHPDVVDGVLRLLLRLALWVPHDAQDGSSADALLEEEGPAVSGRNGDGRAGGEAKVTEEEGEGLDEPTGRPSSSIGHAWPRSTRCSPPRDWLPGSGEGNKGG